MSDLDTPRYLLFKWHVSIGLGPLDKVLGCLGNVARGFTRIALRLALSGPLISSMDGLGLGLAWIGLD